MNKMLFFFLPDERLHKGFEGTGPGQCGGAAECPQVSLCPVGDMPRAANPSDPLQIWMVLGIESWVPGLTLCIF